MPSAKSQSVPAPESVHDVWLRQRAELERELFDGWTPEVHAVPTVSQSMPDAASVRPQEPVLKIHESAAVDQPSPAEQIRLDQARHVERLGQSKEATAKQRAAFEQEMSARETAWAIQRDQEWAALRQAKEHHDVEQQRWKDELAAQRMREREELLQWRRQAEAELAEARRVFEQERLKQQQEFAQQREAEMAQLRRERDEFDTRVRQVQSELAYARQRQEEELRHIRDVQSAQLRAERAELDKLRDRWLEKFRREQIVLENGMRFFGEHLSRVSEELRTAQCGPQAASESMTETNPTEIPSDPGPTFASSRPALPTVLSLDEIRKRLNDLKQPQQAVA